MKRSPENLSPGHQQTDGSAPKWIVVGLILLALFLVSRDLIRGDGSEVFDFRAFSQLPTQHGGRVQPIDSVARNSLLIFRGRQSALTEDGQSLTPAQFITEVAARPEKSDELRIFRIMNPQVKALVGMSGEDRRDFSYRDLRPHLGEVDQAFEAINPESEQRDAYERAVAHLFQSLSIYHRLIHSFAPPDNLDGVVAEYQNFLLSIPDGMEAIRSHERGEPHDSAQMRRFVGFTDRYMRLGQLASLRLILPPEGDAIEDDWQTTGESLIRTIQTGSIDPMVEHYARAIHAYRRAEADNFNEQVAAIQDHYRDRFPSAAAMTQREYWFNLSQVFYRSTELYVIALVLVLFSWLLWPNTLRKASFWILVIAFIAHTIGLVARMWIQGRPPVTNLYSSAVFVGWGAVFLGLIMERLYRNGIGAATAALVGFSTLIIAHSLGASGDTLELMQAVLDDNFWLATHVIVITLGYSATFLAGAIGLFYIIRGMGSTALDRKTAKALGSMVYGIVCFALLFSFAGTVLGGIWADQSWGRFWGWDPKENGALMIVLWLAIMLHARWGGLAGPRGMMLMAIFGNIITAWSWFGTNLLGVGLHAYGFIDGAFLWMGIFVLSQLTFIAAGSLPARFWKSPAAAR